MNGTSTSEAVASPVRMGRPAIAVLGILALALGTLQSVVDPALPLLQRELGVSPAEGALVGNALLVTGAVVAPVAGKLGDRYGGKRVLLRLMAVVSAGGLLASLAPNLPVLLLGQVLQGVMVGALPLSFILVRKHLPTGGSQAAIGVVTALFTGGGIVGTSIAGPIAENLSWHWMFALPTIAIIVATPAVTRLMPHDPPIRSDSGIDWPGVALLSGTLLALMVGLVTVTSAGLPPFAVGAIAVLVAVLAMGWVAVERAVVTAVTMIALASLHTAAWQLLVAKALTAVAAGVGTTALLAGTATAVEAKDTGIATSLLVVTRVISIALGAQLGGAILSAGAAPGTGRPAESAFVTGFVIAGLVAALSLVVVRFTREGTQA
ncbi:MFS transporter [Actinoallomurus spadix]|uniref:Major facilitator superfamily (MFS) profile domain-containing protein n=1 Tax=Actinoallomurus spadix TaxID=79912 RepID=A0ABP3HCJ7_9ACTN|nr:MFS transporter [Actinoallomurus spadix]MCO5985000.1 MFS transporter [Actinoallomurus spadix]